MVDRNKSRAEAELKHFRTFKLPPRGFDALAESDRELMFHGFPRQPNPETHPILAEKWSRIADCHFEFIEPKLEVAPFKRNVDVALIERRRLMQEELLRYERKEPYGIAASCCSI